MPYLQAGDKDDGRGETRRVFFVVLANYFPHVHTSIPAAACYLQRINGCRY